jgi:hypothetical protein
MKVALAIAALVAMVAAPAAAAEDPLVVRDPHVVAVYALHGTVLYQRGTPGTFKRSWWRVVRGKASRPHGLPKDAGAGSIGVDAGGNVVMTMRTFGHSHEYGDWRWWVYDIARGVARPLIPLARAGCVIDAVALWRSRIAYAERCVPSGTDAVMLRSGRRVRRVGSVHDPYTITLQGRSVMAYGSGYDDVYVDPVLTRGKHCPHSGIFAGDEGGWDAIRGVWIGTAGAEWVMGNFTNIGHAAYRPDYTDLAVASVDLTGRCAALKTQRHLAFRPPESAVHAVAIDRRWLYYASDTGIYRQLLAARGSTAPPANDDFEHATPLATSLPVTTTGTVGHATSQPGEQGDRFHARTVWYAWRPAAAMTVSASIGFTDHNIDVFVGPQLAALTRVPPLATTCGLVSFAAMTDQTYWIRISSFGTEPSYLPFKLEINEGPPRYGC